MQMNIPATFGPIYFSGSLEEDWNVYGQTMEDGCQVMAIAHLVRWAKKKGCTPLAATSDKVYKLLAHGLRFSTASSTTKTGRHVISEILLKAVLNTINQSINIMFQVCK